MNATTAPPLPAKEAPTVAPVRAPDRGDHALRALAGFSVVTTFAFLFNDYLTFWQGWPGVTSLYGHFGWFGIDGDPIEGGAVTYGWVQWLLYVVPLAAIVVWVRLSPRRTLYQDADLLSALAAYVVRMAFWVVVLVGLADMLISFLRVENMLEGLVGADLTRELGRSQYRAPAVHMPLVGLAALIALFVRRVSFAWLTLLVVLAEFQIVISRFVFSYEQAFMGDLVRFWYAALFLFASAQTLIEEGHVRVDVFYANFTARGKARTNVAGCALLGTPLCWVILGTGMWGKGSSLNSPLLSFEISQSGYGMYVKYIMAAFLVVFAVSMIVQFASYFLSNAAVLRGDPPRESHGGGGH